MKRKLADLSLIVPGLAVLLLTACLDGTQSPRSRPESPEADGAVEGVLGPVDLVYLCGNKFLATNSTKASVHVEYRVVGTDESGGLTLRPGPPEDPGFSETELETTEQGAVELYRDGERVTHRPNRETCAVVPRQFPLQSPGWAAPSRGLERSVPLPIVALHMSLLPTGKILMWGRPGHAPGLGSGHGKPHGSPQPCVALLRRPLVHRGWKAVGVWWAHQ